ncbi:hypothetical protein D4R08_00055 [Corynebacterium xerosis]|nr:hypothetical protein D4R08_00055 [Corynebacterium xerosis]
MPSGMMTSSARMTFHLPPDFAGAGAVDVAWAAVSAVSGGVGGVALVRVAVAGLSFRAGFGAPAPVVLAAVAT